MDAKLTQALDNLHQHLKVRKPTSQQEIIQAEQEEEIYRPSQPDPSPRDQQDLMTLPFFSLDKSKRTKPIIYEQGNVKVFVEGRPSVGIATIWDADLLIWIASQLNAALEAGEKPTRRLWIVPYQFLTTTKRMSRTGKGKIIYERFKNSLRRSRLSPRRHYPKLGGSR